MARKQGSKWAKPKEFFGGQERPWQDDRDADVASRSRPKFRRAEKPLTAKHLAYQQAIRTHQIILAVSPAGTGKTSLACAVAVEMLKSGNIDNIVIMRPILQCDEDVGTLPGTLQEKMDPFVAPILVIFRELLGAERVEGMLRDGTLEVTALGLIRGRTFHGSFCLVDEAQNASFGQLKTVMSRLGQGSTLVVSGDVEQTDFDYPSPLIDVWKLLKKGNCHPGFAFVTMGEEEQLRPEIVNYVTRRLARNPRA